MYGKSSLGPGKWATSPSELFRMNDTEEAKRSLPTRQAQKMARETKKGTRKQKKNVEEHGIEPMAPVAPGLDLKGLLCAWVMSSVRTLWAWSWLLSVFLAVVLALTLGSYSLNDPSFSVSTSRNPENFCGALGAWTADLMLSAFGFSAWWFVLGSAMIGFFAIRTAWRRMNGETDPLRINPPKITAAMGFLAVLVGSTCLEALRLRRFQMILPGEPGGILGDSLAWGIRHYIGVGLSTVLFAALIAVGLSLLMDFQWGDVAERVGSVICRWIVDPVMRLFKVKGREEELVRQNESDAESAEVGIVPIVRSAEDSATASPVVAPASGESPVEPRQPIVKTAARAESKAAAKPAACSLSMSLLDEPAERKEANSAEDLQMTGRLIVSKLKSYGIESSIGGIQPGPVITQYWLEPGPGVKGSQIDNVRDDLRRTLGVQAVRVVPSIPNTSFIGLEVPNPIRETVRLKEILDSKAFRESTAPLTLALGKDIGGKAFVIDLAKMPHLLVAGTTGSGKSVGINAMILSMLYRNSPADLRLVLIDPKMLEFSLYNGIPHLLCPVVTDMNKAATALKWLTREMDRRYAVMSKLGVRHFNSYNEKIRRAAENGETIPDPMQAPDDPIQKPLEVWPFIVCIVDELADLMLTNRKEVEGEITRLTQKARAAGIHLIIATQRPSVDVVTSLIKANVPTRISFQVASGIDSRVILGEAGAESLLGWGDMLLRRPGVPQSTRIQGCFVADDEVLRVVTELQKMGEPAYIDGVTEDSGDDDGDADSGSGGGRRSGESDPLYDKAVDLVLRERRATISFVQRHLGIGYNRAANLLEAMEEARVVSKANSMGRREILVPEN